MLRGMSEDTNSPWKTIQNIVGFVASIIGIAGFIGSVVTFVRNHNVSLFGFMGPLAPSHYHGDDANYWWLGAIGVVIGILLSAMNAANPNDSLEGWADGFVYLSLVVWANETYYSAFWPTLGCAGVVLLVRFVLARAAARHATS